MIKMTVRVCVAVFGLLAFVSAAAAQTWSAVDIGAVGAAGTSSGSGGSLTVGGAGADVWGSADAFRFTYTTLDGDGSIVTKVGVVQHVNDWTKAGVMMRDSLAAGSRHAFMLVSPGKGLAFQRRVTTSGSSLHTAAGSGAAPYFVKLTRAGSTFKAYKSLDGAAWTLVGSQTIAMGQTIYVGVAVSSHIKGVLATSSFSSTTVAQAASTTAPPPVEPTPVEPTPVEPPPATGTGAVVRVLHWNTHHGGIRTDGVYDPALIASWIANMSPDIASLNEVDNQGQVDAIVNALKAKTGVNWNVSFSGLGNLMLSRLPVASTSRCAYPDGKRYAAHLGTLVNGRPINVWSTHLTVDSASARLAEVRSLQTCALSWAEARILAGDYNMQYGTPEYLAAATGYTDAWLKAKSLGTAVNYAGNCDGCTRNSRIDYVFSSNGGTFLTVKSAQIFDTRSSSGVSPSDHKPLLVVYNVQ